MDGKEPAFELAWSMELVYEDCESNAIGAGTRREQIMAEFEISDGGGDVGDGRVVPYASRKICI